MPGQTLMEYLRLKSISYISLGEWWMAMSSLYYHKMSNTYLKSRAYSNGNYVHHCLVEHSRYQYKLVKYN